MAHQTCGDQWRGLLVAVLIPAVLIVAVLIEAVASLVAALAPAVWTRCPLPRSSPLHPFDLAIVDHGNLRRGPGRPSVRWPSSWRHPGRARAARDRVQA